jgi:LmbE family N-acetylglucosaminyl deacetylase
VLVVGAHPEDVNPALIAFLTRGRHVRTGYLSLTRGEGSANFVGGESNDALAVLRTAEVLVARRVDGAEQYFTRAYDFGLAKTPDEAIERWARVEGGDAVIGDVVKVVRGFRPNVIVSLFVGDARDRDGQHSVAGRLAHEAFAVAGDTTRFSTQHFGRPWSPGALYDVVQPNDSGFDAMQTVRLDVGEFAPMLGRSYAELGAESRARERSQGSPPSPPLGTSPMYVRRLAGPAPVGTAPRTLFDGIDTTLARIRRSAAGEALQGAIDSLPAAIAAVRLAYRPEDPGAAVDPLATLTNVSARAAALAGWTDRGAVYDADAARSLEDLWRDAREALVAASGVAVEATAERETVARATSADSSDTLRVTLAVYNRGRARVVVDGAVMSGAPNINIAPRVSVPLDGVWRGTIAGAPRITSGPWWRIAGRMGDLYGMDVDGRSEAEHEIGNESGALRIFTRLRINGVDALINVPVVYRPTEAGRLGERRVAVVPGATVRLDHAFEFARAGIPLVRPMRVTVQSSFATARDFDVTLAASPGLTIDSATRRVRMPPGGTAVLTYVIRGVPKAGDYILGAEARVGPERYSEGSATLAYDHVPPQRIYFPASTTIRAANVSIPVGTHVGYVTSTLDQTPRMLMELGVHLTQIDPTSLTLPSASLAGFSAIVVAPRTYETAPALLSANARLLQFARAGGTVVVQYGRYEMEQPGTLPYAIALGRPAQGVTDERSPVRLLTPTLPVLSAPNAITGADFGQWVQDRAVFLPATFDPRWRPALEVGDQGEPPNHGALLVAPVGRGTYVYTTLSFFRQFPAANVGAARLFLNLLATRVGPPAPLRTP